MGVKCPEWPADFDEHGGEEGSDIDYRALVQAVWEQLLEGEQTVVVVTIGKVVVIGSLTDIGGMVEVSIDIGQLNFRWSSLDLGTDQLEIPYEA